jgi:hypothetical protein
MSPRKNTAAGATKKKSVCALCKVNPPLEKSVRDARIEDIPDGFTLDLPKAICDECLEAIGNEVAQYDHHLPE